MVEKRKNQGLEQVFNNMFQIDHFILGNYTASFGQGIVYESTDYFSPRRTGYGFAKRNDGNPNTHAFVSSPEMVMAIALSGRLDFNPITDTLTNSENEEIKLDPPIGDELPKNGFSVVNKTIFVYRIRTKKEPFPLRIIDILRIK